MHGLGNDFVLVNALQKKIQLTRQQAIGLANRRFGIGCDQVLLIEPAENPSADIRYRIFNADGGEVAQCGNGARCVAAYLHREQILDKAEIIAETINGCVKLYYKNDDQITVDMGIPKFDPKDIPITADKRADKYTLSVNGGTLEMAALSMGNPHAVIVVDNIDEAPVEVLGPGIQDNPFFPEGVNVGFMQVIATEQIRLRVFERGAGETLACGSGACAAAVAGIQAGLLNHEVQVGLPGGILSIMWQGEGEPVLMRGSATFVYEGWIDL